MSLEDEQDFENWQAEQWEHGFLNLEAIADESEGLRRDLDSVLESQQAAFGRYWRQV